MACATFIPLLEFLLVEVCGFLEVEQLLLGELTLAVRVMHCQHVCRGFGVCDASAACELALKLLEADEKSTFLLGFESWIGLRLAARNMAGTGTSSMTGNAGATRLGRRCVGDEGIRDCVVHFLAMRRSVCHGRAGAGAGKCG